MSLLKYAIEAGIPLISCRTSDPLHLEEVLNFYAGTKVMRWTPNQLGKTIPHPTVFYGLPNEAPSFLTKQLYDTLINSDSILILVNSESDKAEAFNVGELVTPIELMLSYLKEIVHEEDAQKLVRYMNGLTIKQMAEVIRLCQCMYGDLTPRAVMSVRSAIIGNLQGLQQVETSMGFYQPPSLLQEWLALNGPYFLNGTDDRLAPRGIIFYGPPGVGKTEASKYIAKEWGVPLYRLDLSSSLGKYVGESEANLTRILRTVDTEEPCVMLLDEVEKLFKQGDDGGVTTRLLSQLLWWLQEHKSRVLTVMTTNDLDVLPKELYRAGRIDEQIRVNPLSLSQAKSFAAEVIKDLKITEKQEAQDKVGDWLVKLGKFEKEVAHVEVIRMVHKLIKINGWKTH